MEVRVLFWALAGGAERRLPPYILGMAPNPLQHLMPTCHGAKAVAAGAEPAAAPPAADALAGTVRLNEIFHSIHGESTWAGMPCVFVRLTGCPLRCTYCDTEYAFREGRTATLREIVEFDHRSVDFVSELMAVLLPFAAIGLHLGE